MLRFKFFVLFGTHTLLDKPLSIIQFSTHLTNLTTNFVWLEALTKLVNNAISIYLTIPHILYIIFKH